MEDVYGGDDHEDHIDAVELTDEQAGKEGGQDDDDASHGGGARLLALSFQAQLADGLPNLFPS